MSSFRWLVLVGIAAATLTPTSLLLAQPERVSYLHMSKREIVRRLGLPAEITLATGDAPAQEVWWYYYDDPQLGLTAAFFGFAGNKVSGYAAHFDAKHLVSTETAEGFARVYARIVKQRKRTH